MILLETTELPMLDIVVVVEIRVVVDVLIVVVEIRVVVDVLIVVVVVVDGGGGGGNAVSR
jgi:hypothetical protein